MKATRRNISEISPEEKVQIHFKFNDLHKGYAEIAKDHLLDNCDIYTIVHEIDSLRAKRAENLKVKHVYRRVHINKNREVKPQPKKQKEPRPDNRRKVITRELDLRDRENDYLDDFIEKEEKKPVYHQKNCAMALALQKAMSKGN
ncbi:hypothetical protein PHYNN_31 [Pantoea phage Phynn]|nr:hypothetical protein PHYNN_31 [Pantoea phage Phynn]